MPRFGNEKAEKTVSFFLPLPKPHLIQKLFGPAGLDGIHFLAFMVLVTLVFMGMTFMLVLVFMAVALLAATLMVSVAFMVLVFMEVVLLEALVSCWSFMAVTRRWRPAGRLLFQWAPHMHLGLW